MTQEKMTGESEESLQKKTTNRTQILHDLKKIAVAINELCRDLDRIEREGRNE